MDHCRFLKCIKANGQYLYLYFEILRNLHAVHFVRYRVSATASPEKIMGANLLQTLKRKEKKTGPPLYAAVTQPRHNHSFGGSFSAGSKPIFASKAAFFSIFQNLQENHLLASKFWKFLPKNWKNLQNF